MKRTPVAGVESWFRESSFHLGIPLNGMLGVNISKEKVLSVNGEDIPRPDETMYLPMNLTDEFPLLNSDTDAPTGAKMSMQDLVDIIHSLSLHVKEKQSTPVAP